MNQKSALAATQPYLKPRKKPYSPINPLPVLFYTIDLHPTLVLLLRKQQNVLTGLVWVMLIPRQE